MEFGLTSVTAITAICYFLAQIIKATEVDNKWLPILCGLAGGFLGILGFSLMPGFPAEDYLTAIAVGMASGFAATGIHQSYRQLSGGDQGES